MQTLIGLIVALFLLVFVFKIFFKVSGIIFGFLINSLIGAIVLGVLNFLGLGIKINWLTTSLVGLMGVPGLIIVIVLKFIFHVV